jgi:hypothetical protein
MVLMTPSQLVLKLSWDNQMPANSDFTLGQRNTASLLVDIWQIGQVTDGLYAFAIFSKS